MELYQLRYFKTVAETEHFTRAAEQLHIAQPSLSKAIANLEAELGVLLFERKSRSVHLTDYGNALLVHANRILEEEEEARLEIQDMLGEAKGDIYVGSCAVFNAPSEIYSYNRKAFFAYPNMSLHLYIMETSQIEQMLLDHKIDFGLSVSVAEHFGIKSTELCSYHLGVVVNKNHPLANRKSVKLIELKDENFMCNNTSPDLKDSVYEMCHKAGFEPKMIFEGESAELIGEAVQQGRGLAFISTDRHAFQQKENAEQGKSEIVLLPLEDDFCKRTVYLLELKDRYLPTVARRYRDGMLQHLQTQRNNT